MKRIFIIPIILNLAMGPFALNAMDEAKAPESLKHAAISITFNTPGQEKPITKDLTISYVQRGKIASSSESLTQTFSIGAYRAEVEIEEQTDVGHSGSRYTGDLKLCDSLKVLSKILINGELRADSFRLVLVNAKEFGLGNTANYPAQGAPEFTNLVIIASEFN